jgi:L-fuculose-phosphate aldolase
MTAMVEEERLSQARRLLVTVAHRAYARGLTLGVSGNLSVRLPDVNHILIKATGKCLGDLAEEDTVLVDLEGIAVDPLAPPPSKESLFHVAIYRQRPDVMAVVHLHPPYAVSLAVRHLLPPLLTGAARAFLGGKMALVGVAPSGSRELAALVGRAFEEKTIRAAILAEHGTITVGADLWEAFYLSEYLEDAARVACLVGLSSGAT